jgi:hypothetical protein
LGLGRVRDRVVADPRQREVIGHYRLLLLLRAQNEEERER